ncbi:MAG: hypothetical protein AABM67_17905 [Acidobacteriota bacterium]
MKEINERPVCHRAEDLVTYLYNEASETESRDFASHAQACDACRAELAVFQQVHESISLWRNEALGASFTTGFSPSPVMTETASVRTEPRRLSALAALRQFFVVSPLWLRGATAFAALMLCVLAVLAISRSWNKPVTLSNNQPRNDQITNEQFEAAVAKEVNSRIEKLKIESSTGTESAPPVKKASEKDRPTQLAGTRVKARQPGLTRQEREQLAADLRLIPRDDEDLPFVFSEEPNQ